MNFTGTHRRDIDGLRAVAVLLVVLYHYQIWPFTGGYVGVDVFFVISGFVITAKIRRELADGSFTLRGFYAGRVRRILPALTFMVGACLVAGWFLLMPPDYRSLGEQAAYSLFGVSNFYFHETSGYFARASDLLPLLHTWSLGIEEQFYLVWPALILLLLGGKLSNRSVALILIALIAISLAVATILVFDDKKTAFYMLHARAWELAAGGLLTFLPLLRRPLLANIAGLTLIGLSAVFLKTGSVFPGPFAIPACLGAALLIWPKASDDLVSRALSFGPVVGIGLISYSLYLWHWPVLVFYRHINFEQEPIFAWKLALIAVGVMLATFSYLAIEQPIRSWKSLRKFAVPVPIAATVLIAFTGIGVTIASGVQDRIPAAALSVAQGASDVSEHRDECHRPLALREAPIESSCRLGAPGVEPASIIWGDSHAVELGDALSQAIALEGGSLLSVSYSSCPPAIGFERAITPACDEHNDAVLNYVLSNNEIKTVFLVAQYEGVLQEDETSFTAALGSTVATLADAGKKVVLFTPVPTSDGSVPLVASRMMMHDDMNVLMISRANYLEVNHAILALMDELDRMQSVFVIQVAPLLCHDMSCRTVASGRSLYFDRHHPSMFGAKWLVNRIWAEIKISLAR